MWGAEDHPLVVLGRVAEASASAVGDLKTCIPIDTLREAVRMIGAANCVAVAGPNQAYALAAWLADGLIRQDRCCLHLRSLCRRDIERVSSMGINDVLVAISLSNGMCPVLDIVSTARDRGLHVLGITVSAASPLARQSDVSIVVGSQERHAVQPLAPHIVLIQSLLVSLNDARIRELLAQT